MDANIILELLLLGAVVLQLLALYLRIRGWCRSALCAAGVIPLAQVVLMILSFLPSAHISTPWYGFCVLFGAALAETVAGLIVRPLAGWLFWPVWATDLLMICFLAYLHFSSHVF